MTPSCLGLVSVWNKSGSSIPKLTEVKGSSPADIRVLITGKYSQEYITGEYLTQRVTVLQPLGGFTTF